MAAGETSCSWNGGVRLPGPRAEVQLESGAGEWLCRLFLNEKSLPNEALRITVTVLLLGLPSHGKQNLASQNLVCSPRPPDFLLRAL